MELSAWRPPVIECPDRAPSFDSLGKATSPRMGSAEHQDEHQFDAEGSIPLIHAEMIELKNIMRGRATLWQPQAGGRHPETGKEVPGARAWVQEALSRTSQPDLLGGLRGS